MISKLFLATTFQSVSTIVFLIVIVSVVVSIVRIKKVKERRDEEERRRRERMQPPVSPTPPRTHAEKPAPEAVRRNHDPFPTYRPDPFADAQGEHTGTLSPAQLHEWIIDFTMAEQAGVRHRSKKDGPTVFARYLHYTDFSYRELRKRSGYTPQNRLQIYGVAEKVKPANVTTVLRNGVGAKKQDISKSPVPFAQSKQYLVPYPEAEKPRDNRAVYEGFYIDA